VRFVQPLAPSVRADPRHFISMRDLKVLPGGSVTMSPTSAGGSGGAGGGGGGGGVGGAAATSGARASGYKLKLGLLEARDLPLPLRKNGAVLRFIVLFFCLPVDAHASRRLLCSELVAHGQG
jgi:hypothetical protein